MKTVSLASMLAGLLAAAGPTTPAPAQPVAVSVAGLDLATPAGQRTLDRRILHAASEACGTPSAAADSRAAARLDDCRREAVRAAAPARARLVAAASAPTRVADAR